MKKQLFAVLLIITIEHAFAQNNWKLSGNSGISNSDFLGTTDNKSLVFKTNNTERGRLTSAGIWRFGTSSNYAQINTSGNLTFNGSATYQVEGNSYVFRYASNPNYGLYFNSTTPRYELRNSSGTPVFSVNANNGNGVFNGKLKIGSYTLPSIDGLSGQVLKTNGSGVLSWSNDMTGGGTVPFPVGGNSYIYYYSVNPNYGLYFNSSSPRWDYRNGFGNSVFAVDANDGALFMNGQKFFLNPGNQNLPIGIQALNSNTTGYANIAIGDESLFANDAGYGNVAIGHQSLKSNTTGFWNTATGDQSMVTNITGQENAAYGVGTLYFNTVGSGNTALGNYSLQYNTSGNANVGVGNYSLFVNTTGRHNAATGDYAMYNNTVGEFNAGFGPGALSSNTIGSHNVGVGYATLLTNTTGGSNTVVGDQADVAADGFTNATAIGASTIVDASDKVRIGNTSVTSIGGEVSWTTFSDGRYKRNIKENVPGLDFINSLRPITYTVDISGLNSHYTKNRKTGESEVIENLKTSKLGEKLAYSPNNSELNPKMKESENDAAKIIYTGFAAQEVEAAAKKLNFEFSGVDKPKNADGLYGLRYDQFVMPLVKAVQEISTELKTKDEKINNQQKQIDDLTLRIEKMEGMLLASYKGNVQNINIENEALLEQNAPNPFKSGTTIRYQLPEKFSLAQIIVTDNNGQVIKQVNVTGTGKGSLNINTSRLAAGAYQYSLSIDGKIIATKQMLLVK